MRLCMFFQILYRYCHWILTITLRCPPSNWSATNGFDLIATQLFPAHQVSLEPVSDLLQWERRRFARVKGVHLRLVGKAVHVPDDHEFDLVPVVGAEQIVLEVVQVPLLVVAVESSPEMTGNWLHLGQRIRLETKWDDYCYG